jgi:hypothetical protein
MKYVFNPVSGQLDLINTFTDSNYIHTQAVANTTWNVPHNLGKRCSVQVVDNLGNEIVGSIQWIDDNNVTVTFNTAITGFVYCN